MGKVVYYLKLIVLASGSSKNLKFEILEPLTVIRCKLGSKNCRKYQLLYELILTDMFWRLSWPFTYKISRYFQIYKQVLRYCTVYRKSDFEHENWFSQFRNSLGVGIP